MKTIVLVTGGFDPVHSGHIEYLKAARKLGDILIVGVNSDAWLTRKKGRSFMPIKERAAIMRSLQGVDFVIDFDDSDGSAQNAIIMTRQSYPQDRIIFANGGDRGENNIPEMNLDDPLLEFRFGVGGDNKANSSSWILQEWKAPRTDRDWGHYRVLYELGKEVKVKELAVQPGSSLSMQKHQHRNELWFVARGHALVHHNPGSTELKIFDNTVIKSNQWHQLTNVSDEPLHIIEIQYGDCCQEQDIERLLIKS